MNGSDNLILTGWGYVEYVAAAAAALKALGGDADVRGVSRRRLPELMEELAAARALAAADALVTCVGAKALKFIVPNLTAGVRLRAAESGKPLNLLICENLMDADAVLRGLIDPHLTESEKALLGLVETSVGRMVPLPDKELLEKEPLLARACNVSSESV